MSSPSAPPPSGFIWATRVRNWGFRFLRRGGLDDPLGTYEEAFTDVADRPEVWHRTGDMVALRFSDPLQRQDAAGRVIPHDFVLFGSWAAGLNSLEEGQKRMWLEVADEFASVWDQEPPLRTGQPH